MKNIPRIVEVKPEDNMMLIVKFDNGKIKLMDIKPYLDTFEVFKKLENKKLFGKVKVDVGGFGIVWNKNIDLDRCDIWEYGKTIN